MIPILITEYRLVFIILLILTLACTEVPNTIETEYTRANIQVPHFYPCHGYDENQQPLTPNYTFNSNINRIYICGFLDPNSRKLSYNSKKLYLGVDWKNISSGDYFPFWEQDYYYVGAGWFYPVLKIPAEGLPIGVYEVKLYAGRTVEASTTFEVVTAE